jgi:hypothetical protein
LPREASTAIGTACGFGLRLLALRYHWETRSIRNHEITPGTREQ